MSEEEKYWMDILKKHWLKLLPFAVVIIAAFFSGIYVFLWHNDIGIGAGTYWTYTFNDWSFASIFVYLLWLLLREFLLVFLPMVAVLGIIFAAIWFTRSQEERDELKAVMKRGEKKEKHRKKTSTGFGGFSTVTFIVFLIIMAANGKWETLFANIDLQYFVATYLWAMLWVAVCVGVPVLIGVIIWLIYKNKK